MNPAHVQLESPEKEFEYEKIARTVDRMDDIEEIKMMLKYTIKMGMKQTEVFSKMLLIQIGDNISEY
tara:strand:- start:593 stop:793 length:201 start_codon:yes stop_codon:yes gene_type:complete